jgi:hypothetical protein
LALMLSPFNLPIMGINAITQMLVPPPAQLRSTGSTAGQVSLEWDASTDDVGVARPRPSDEDDVAGAIGG